MDKEEKKKEYPELNPDATTMTEEDKAENKIKEKPKPWAPPPRRHED